VCVCVCGGGLNTEGELRMTQNVLFDPRGWFMMLGKIWKRGLLGRSSPVCVGWEPVR